jgi:hypothetical protein
MLSAWKEFLLLNCVVSNELVPLSNGVACNESVSLSMCYLQRISIRCRNWVVCSEFGVHCRIVCSTMNLGFAVEVVWSTTNLKFTTEIELFTANLKFAAEIELFAMNVNSLPYCVFHNKLGIHCRSCMVCSKFEIRCWNWVICSDLTFVVKLCVLQRIWDSLPKLYGL